MERVNEKRNGRGQSLEGIRELSLSLTNESRIGLKFESPRKVMGGAATPEGVFCCTHYPCQSRSSGQCSGCVSSGHGRARRTILVLWWRNVPVLN
eukprot:scaffold7970_cov125-Isochrysis_galbana.AAC.4